MSFLYSIKWLIVLMILKGTQLVYIFKKEIKKAIDDFMIIHLCRND